MANTQNASNENQTGFQSLNNATGAMAGRTITAGSSALTVTNGNGIGGNPTITLTSPVSLSNGGTGTSAILTQGSILYAGASGVYTGDSTLLIWDAPSSAMVIGDGSSALDGSRLVVSCKSSSSRGLSLTGTLSSTGVGNTQYGFFLNPTFSTGAAPILSAGMAILPKFSSESGSLTTNASGLYISNNPTDNAGTLSNLYGLYIESGSSGSGTITNAYGLFVKRPTAGTSRYTAIIGDTGSDMIGFGTPSPSSASLTTFSHTSSGYGILLTGTTTGLDSSTNSVGLYSNQTFSPAVNAGWFSSFLATPIISLASGRTVSQVTAISASLYYVGNSGTITNAYGLLVDSGDTGAGTITNTYGGCFRTPTAGINKVALYSDCLNVGQDPNTQNTSGCIQYTGRPINTSSSHSTVYCVHADRTTTFTFASNTANQVAIYNNKIFDGSNSYNTTTGIFTAPVSGFYLFSFQIYTVTKTDVFMEFADTLNAILWFSSYAQTGSSTASTQRIRMTGGAYLTEGTGYKFLVSTQTYGTGESVAFDSNDYMYIALLTATS